MARGAEVVQAVDHDMHPDAVLAPAGILELATDQLNIVFGTSRDTSDFVADALEVWWTNRRQVRRLEIDLDNGPEIASSRTQFMKRLVELSDRPQLTLELAYYPPYHSKYNPIERCWGILENHWNGVLLTSIDTVLSWAKTMTWRAVTPECVCWTAFTKRAYAFHPANPNPLPTGSNDPPSCRNAAS